MYCPSCGKDINPELSFCNHCGARIGVRDETDQNTLSESSFNLLVGALLSIPIVGICLIVGLLIVMKRELGMSDDMIESVIAGCFFMLLTSEAGFIWLMLTRTRKRKTKHDTGKKRALKTADPWRLGEAGQDPIPASVYTVTEHTTRTLDEVPLVPKEK